MNTQYRKNLKAVLEASKTYCDESISNLKWELGTYDLGVDTDNSVARVKTLHANTIKSMVNYIGGKSVKYNQLVQNGNFADTSNWSYWSQVSTFSVSNNEMTVTSAGSGCSLAQVLSETIPSGHKVIVSFEAKSNDSNDTIYFQYYNGATLVITEQTDSALTTSFKRFNIITTLANQATRIQFYRGLASGSIIFRQVALIDLTDIFGAGNEPSSVETAIPLLKANGYKLDGTDTYSTGSLKHAITTSVEYLPINVWNEETELGVINQSNGQPVYSSTNVRSKNFCECLPSTTYYLYTGTSNSYIYWYDSEYNYISFNGMNRTYTTPNNAHYFKITEPSTTYKNDICINISNASYNGNYYPYIAPITKAIPSEVLADTRYGLGFDNTNYNHLDSDGHLRGDRNKAKLKDFAWVMGENNVFRATRPNDAYVNITDTIATKLIAREYNAVARDFVANNDMSIAMKYEIFIKDTRFNNATDFKNHFTDDDYLEYPLAQSFDQDYSQYFTPNWNKVDLDNKYATCEMVVAEPIDMPNSISNLFEEVKA